MITIESSHGDTPSVEIQGKEASAARWPLSGRNRHHQARRDGPSLSGQSRLHLAHWQHEGGDQSERQHPVRWTPLGRRALMPSSVVVRDCGHRGKVSRKAVVLALVALLGGCKSDTVWTTSDLVPQVRLIIDSPDARYLISEQEKNDAAELQWLEKPRKHDEQLRGVENRRQHPEQYAPTLSSFNEAMEAAPGFLVRGGDLCQTIERSRARCSSEPLSTFVYVKVRLTNGSDRGRQGWACEARDVFSTSPFF